METIKIKGKAYPIKEIAMESEHILRIIFVDEIPKEYKDVKVYTAGDVECADLTAYTTVYKQDKEKVWLSDDDSTYPVLDIFFSPEAEPYVPTIEELRQSKWQEINSACTQIIHAGVDVKLTSGKVEHFSLTETDQLNLFGLRAQLAAGIESVPYHADGAPCKFYSGADMIKIIEKSMEHAIYHTTYCNALHMWITAAEESELKQIIYGVQIPEKYQSDVLKAYFVQRTEQNDM